MNVWIWPHIDGYKSVGKIPRVVTQTGFCLVQFIKFSIALMVWVQRQLPFNIIIYPIRHLICGISGVETGTLLWTEYVYAVGIGSVTRSTGCSSNSHHTSILGTRVFANIFKTNSFTFVTIGK